MLMKIHTCPLVDDNRNAEEVSLVITPQENRTPTIGLRQEQVEAMAKNVEPDRNQ